MINYDCKIIKYAYRDRVRGDFLSQENNPANKGEIYETYLQLNDRQEAIKPLLPFQNIIEYLFLDY